MMELELAFKMRHVMESDGTESMPRPGHLQAELEHMNGALPANNGLLPSGLP